LRPRPIPGGRPRWSARLPGVKASALDGHEVGVRAPENSQDIEDRSRRTAFRQYSKGMTCPCPTEYASAAA
jgi:hypothetical protein